MTHGINKAKPTSEKSFSDLAEEFGRLKNSNASRSCVFISHKNEDTLACEKIAEYFQAAGIDVLCVVSKQTINSYWVPFEVGYGYGKLKLGALTLKDMLESELPDYMKTTSVIRGTSSLNQFIVSIFGRTASFLESRSIIKSASSERHPLDSVLNWKQ